MISMTPGQPPPYPLLVGSRLGYTEPQFVGLGQNAQEGVVDQIVGFILTAEDNQAGALIAEHFPTREARASLQTQLAARGLTAEQMAPAFAVATKLEKAGVPVAALIATAFILGGLAVGAALIAGPWIPSRAWSAR